MVTSREEALKTQRSSPASPKDHLIERIESEIRLTYVKPMRFRVILSGESAAVTNEVVQAYRDAGWNIHEEPSPTNSGSRSLYFWV